MEVHTINKDVTPEHIEAIRNVKQSNEINTWTEQDFDTYVLKMEKDALFHARGNFLAAANAWGYVLFPSDQQRDDDKFPTDYQERDIRDAKDLYINRCRNILAKIESIEISKNPTKDINGDEFTLEFRVRRLVKDRKEMFDQFRWWEKRFNRINNPTLAIDDSDSSLKDDETTTSYQKLLLYLLEKTYDEGYRRYKGHCCIQIRNTRAWRSVKEIKKFI